MTEQERNHVVGLLSATIKENGPIPLPVIPKYVSVRSYTGSMGVKRWLEAEFPEFSVLGTNGRELLDFASSALSKFYRLLLQTVPLGSGITQISAATVMKLIRKAGLDPETYGNTRGMQQLLRIYPDYELTGQVSSGTEAVQNQKQPQEELSFIHSITYMNWRMVSGKILQFSVNKADRMEKIRETVTHNFARALLDGEGLFLDALNDELHRVVFATGYTNDDGAPICCILEPNEKEYKRQAWKLTAVVYPGEEDANGMGLWLNQRFFLRSDLSYRCLKENTEELTALRAKLLGGVARLMQSLQDFSCPEPLAGDIAAYESMWETLKENLKQFPTLPNGGEIRVPELLKLLGENNELVDIGTKAVSRFEQICDDVGEKLRSITGDTEVTRADAEQVRELFTGASYLEDVERFRSILHPYHCLDKVRQTDRGGRGGVCGEIEILEEHFGLTGMDCMMFVMGKNCSLYACLDGLNGIEQDLEYLARAAAKKTETPDEQMDTDALAGQILALEHSGFESWIRAYHAMMPVEKELRRIILPEESGDSAEALPLLTPSRIADRLMEAGAEYNQLAERYLLMGLVTDRKACVLRLLGYYRVNGDIGRFLEVWESRYREDSYTLEDACQWLLLRCEKQDITLDEVAEFVTLNPGIKDIEAYQDVIRARFLCAGEQTRAYQGWIGVGGCRFNELELAVVNNDPDALYLMLEDPERIGAMGYAPEEIDRIRQAVSEGLVQGISITDKASRLYQVQKNKNGAMEQLLWSVPLREETQTMLIDLYSEDDDYDSVYWLMQKFSIEADSPKMVLQFATALSRVGQHSALSELLMGHPELWHRTELLGSLPGEPWEGLLAREFADPIQAMNPFAAALIEDRTADMAAMLDDSGSMASWGYDGETVEKLREKLAAGGAPAGTDRASVARRFKYYQGNLHRNMEQYLYQQIYVNREWAIQQLYALAYGENRYFDAARYYESNVLLSRSETNAVMYMWCLLRLGETRQIVEQALRVPNTLRADRELVDAVLEYARQNQMQEFSDELRRIIVRLPRNAFEELVMQSKHGEMQKYVSDPTQLTALGYSTDMIEKFKQRVSMPLPYGNEGYPLGLRMSLFFGDERAIPFLEDAKEDPRAARLLLKSHHNLKDWDAVCECYRERLSEGIWNADDEKRYLEALRKSQDPENCLIYLEYLQSDPAGDQSSSDYQWNYLRGLVGAGREKEAVAQMAHLLEGGYACMPVGVSDLFDMAWDRGSEDFRRRMVLFAAGICLKHQDELSTQRQQQILSLNGRLLEDENTRSWIDLLRENGLDRALTLLMCYFDYGVGSDGESRRAAGEMLFAMLDEADGAHDNGMLSAVTKFATRNGLTKDTASEAYQRLLRHWLDLMFDRAPESGLLVFECISEERFDEFKSFWENAVLTDEQMQEVCEACLTDAEEAQNRSAAFFRRITSILKQVRDHEEYELRYSGLLMDAFAGWFRTINGNDADSLQTAVSFLKDAAYSGLQLQCFLDSCRDLDTLYTVTVHEAVEKRCEKKWNDVLYGYLQNLYFSVNRQDRRQLALRQAQQLLDTNEIRIGTDNQSVQFAYSIVCNNLTPLNLERLAQLYSAADKPEQAQIIRNIKSLNNGAGDIDACAAWFRGVLENNTPEWIERYCKWWAPLVQINNTDDQTRDILSYLSNDEAGLQYRDSVLRLLMSDLFHAAYIDCYLRLESRLAPVGRAKLIYFRTKRDPSSFENAIQECIREKQYLYAIKLLTEQVRTISAHSVFIGRSLGEIYTKESLELCPELIGYIPDVYRIIIFLNRVDTGGAWKNTGRAVDIAILTGQEHVFLDVFEQEYQNVYGTYSGKCAAVIASMMLRGKFDLADRYLNELVKNAANDKHRYPLLLSHVMAAHRDEGVLSPENELLLRSIPVSGNMRSLEIYGSMVSYAQEKDWLEPCARAFYTLRAYTSKDKALLSGCMYLYSVVAGEFSLTELYEVAREYLETVQDNLVNRQLQSLAIIAACTNETIDYRQFVLDCQCRDSGTDVMKKVGELWSSCCSFLDAEHGSAESMNFLIRAATGWWRIDSDTMRYLKKYPNLRQTLVELYPTSFYSAILVWTLRDRHDRKVQNIAKELISFNPYDWLSSVLSDISAYPDDACAELIRMLDIPMDLTGLYTECLDQTVAEPDEEKFRRRMTLLLTIQRNYLTRDYENNVCSLKELMESASESRQRFVYEQLTRKALRNSGRKVTPKECLQIGDYRAALFAAERELENNTLSDYLKAVNESYRDLGAFMLGLAGPAKYGLGKMMNMATVLCQSTQYADLDKLMDICPAKWKLCLRSVQELIQGDPRNVVYLLLNKSFQLHEGCYAFVLNLLRRTQQHSGWKKMIDAEMQKVTGSDGYKKIDLSAVPAPRARVTVFMILPYTRNPAELEPFTTFVDRYIALMNEEDRKDNGQEEPLAQEADEEDIELQEEITDFAGDADQLRRIPFIADCLKRYKPDEQGTAEVLEAGEAGCACQQTRASAEERKQALVRQLSENPGNEETIRLCEELLVILFQERITGETKQYCVRLGLAKFNKTCEQRGSAVYVTKEARSILYSMSALAQEMAGMPGMGPTVKGCLQQCLESYEDLSELTGDCEKDDLLALCEVVAGEDRDGANYLKKHIRFCREIGQKMRKPMTNRERRAWLQECITQCRALEHPVEKEAKQTLAALLDKEIRSFRNKAQIEIKVYNEECDPDCCCIFGSVSNVGGEAVTNLVLSLYVNGVFENQCFLPTLECREMVPFSFSIEVEDEDAEKITCNLRLKYATTDGSEDYETPAQDIVLREMEQCRYQNYDASNPADSDNYVERPVITAVLEANYLVDGGFRRFPNFAIFGMKRSGKSSILRRIGRLFKEHYPDDVVHLIVSCEGITGDFYQRVHAVFVKYVLQEMKKKLEVDRVDGWNEFSEKWKQLPEDTVDFSWLEDFCSELTRQWLPGRGLVLMIDEIERLYYVLTEEQGESSSEDRSDSPESVKSSHAESMLWEVLNKISQSEEAAIRFVLCGSDFFTSKIINWGDNMNQFFQKSVKLNVERMERVEIVRALRANPTIDFDPDTISYLWDLINGLPWHTKLACNAVINEELIKKSFATRTTIYPSDIQDAVDTMIHGNKDVASPANFGLLSLTKEEALIIRVAAEALESRMAKISRTDLLELVAQTDEALGKDTTPYGKALGSLINERKLLRTDRSMNCQFGSELYRLYLRRETLNRFKYK